MKISLVGSSGYDYHKVEHVCLSYESALKRWVEIRDKLIKQCEEMVVYENEEGLFKSGGWEKDIKSLQELKPGGDCNCNCDNPFINEMETEP